jgi:hypothetical protein
VLLVAATLTLGGCAELLPKAQSEVTSPWKSFDEAKATIERIEPGLTSLAEVRAQGIDPYTSPNVQLLNYSDIVLRFPMASGILDPGLRQCLEAGKACIGYWISVRDTHRDRTGNFWLDALRFKRVVDTTGWSFNALILSVNERVVYTLYGGQPNVHEHEVTRQPLGPLQNWGDSVKPPDYTP